jgi:hypothetical protein
VVVSAERYLKLDVAGADARLVVSLTFGELAMARVRQAADRDADGRVSAAESEVYLAAWRRDLQQEIVVELDGSPVALDWRDAYLALTGEVATAEMVGHFSFDDTGAQAVLVRDRMPKAPFERTDVGFIAREGAELLRSGQGENPTGRVQALVFGPNTADELVLSVVVRVPMIDRSSTSRPAIALAIATVAAVILAWSLFVRSRNRRRELPKSDKGS